MKNRNRALSLLLVFLLAACAGCKSGPPGFDFGAYSEAERLYEEKKYPEAIAKYEEYLREKPGGNMAVIASYYKAKCHEELGQTGEARKLYDEIVHKHPGLVWADFSKARLVELSASPDSGGKAPRPESG